MCAALIRPQIAKAQPNAVDVHSGKARVGLACWLRMPFAWVRGNGRLLSESENDAGA